MKYIKENLRMVIAVSIALILIILGIVYLKVNSSKLDKLENSKTEEVLLDMSGISKEKAIELVKPYLSNEYTYTIEVTNDNLYKVTAVKEDITKIYYVDPSNSKVYEDMKF